MIRKLAFALAAAATLGAASLSTASAHGYGYGYGGCYLKKVYGYYGYKFIKVCY